MEGVADPDAMNAANAADDALPEAERARVKGRIADRLDSVVYEAIERYSEDRSRRLLLMCLALAARNGYSKAKRLLEAYDAVAAPGCADLIQVALLRSRIAHEQGQYAESGRQARHAESEAKRHQAMTGLHLARLARAEAMRMQSSLRLPVGRGWFISPIGLVRSLAEMALFTWLAGRYLKRERASGRRPTPDIVKLEAEHAECLIRLGTFYNGLLAILRKLPFLVRTVGAFWRRVEEVCHRAGYAHGVANAHKYGYRVGFTDWRVQGLRLSAVYAMVQSRMGRAQIIVDAVEKELDEGRTARVIIRRQLLEAIRLGRGIDAPAVIVKAIALLRRVSPISPRMYDRFVVAYDRMEGKAMKRNRDRICTEIRKYVR